MDHPSSSVPGSVAAGKSDKTVKEESLPPQLVETVEAFKKYVTEQKEVREEISRIPCHAIAKVQEETAALRQLLCTVENGIQRNAGAVERLKRETAEDLKNAEIAHHTKETPTSLQYENTAPNLYFQKLVENYNQQMRLYKGQIEELEQHFASLASSSKFSPQELTATVKKLHASFVSLAAQLQNIHAEVQRRKDALSSGKMTVPPSKPQGGTVGSVTTAVTLGPTPFSSTRSDAALAMATALARVGQPTLTENVPLGSFATQPSLGMTGGFGSSMFGTTSGLGTSFFGATSPFKPLGTDSFGSSANQTFQLQKPPPGNKRGKK